MTYEYFKITLKKIGKRTNIKTKSPEKHLWDNTAFDNQPLFTAVNNYNLLTEKFFENNGKKRCWRKFLKISSNQNIYLKGNMMNCRKVINHLRVIWNVI